MTTPPFIINLAPTPGELEFGLTSPIRFSIRDADTFISPTSVQITVGYAHIKANGAQEFDVVLPRTIRSSILPGAVITVIQPTIVPVVGGISITKTSSNNQPSVYVTALDAKSGIHSFLSTIVIEPTLVSNGQPGAVFGVENGPRNTGVYVFLEITGGIPLLRMCGPANSVGVRSPNTVIARNWVGPTRYIIVWNELTQKVELYRLIDESTTSLINSENISSFQEFDPISGGTPKKGGSGDVTMVYGIEGQTGEQVIIGNVALTIDVGFPIIGLTRTGEFQTLRRTDETIRYDGGHPIKSLISSWFGPDDKFFDVPDLAGVIKVLSTNAVRLTKLTLNSSMALYREEPSLFGSDTDGFMIEGSFFAIPSQLISSKITGMGFFVFDGQSVYYLGLLSGDVRTVGLLRRNRDPSIAASFQTPDSAIDWASSVYFRLTIDPRREVIDLYGSDINIPKLSIAFDRTQLPQASEFGLVGKNPIVAFGHLSDIATAGSFDLSRLLYSCSYQAFEAKDGELPDDLATDPIWVSTIGGFSPGSLPNPLFGLSVLGGGFGILPLGLYLGSLTPPTDISIIENNQLVLETKRGVTHVYSRSLAIDPNRGAVIEFRIQIIQNKPHARTGYYVFIDDGVHTYALSFVDTEIGKFVCVPIRSGSGLVEIVGTEGLASKLSKQINWGNPHIYRFERRPLDGVYLFVDNATDPILVILESDRIDYPQSQFLTPTVAFGHFSGEGARSLTDFVRVMVSEGYEISTKKVDTTAQLEQDVRNTQAVVVVLARDNDP